MPDRSSRQGSPGMFAMAAGVLGFASTVTFAAEAASGGRISTCTRIDEPGSYLLTRNLTATDSCIVVAADDVTIDLGGWVIDGAGAIGFGITDDGNQRRGITLRNGAISGFNVAVSFLHTTEAVVEKVRASGIETGVSAGRNSIVRNNRIFGTAHGILADSGSIVSGNIVRSGDGAIAAGYGSIVSDNVVSAGDFGITAGPASTVNENNIGALDVAIIAGPGSIVSRNTTHPQEGEGESLAVGIRVTCPSNLLGNTATGADENLVLTGPGCTSIGNLAP